MSNNPYQKPDQPDAYQYNQPKKKGSAKWFLIGGCGCFSLVLACCCGVGIYFFSMTQNFMTEQITFAENSLKVSEELGDGVVVDVESANVTQNPDDPSLLEFRFNIKGDSDEAVLVFVGKIESVSSGWILNEIYLEKDGEKIDLDPDTEFDFGLDELE